MNYPCDLVRQPCRTREVVYLSQTVPAQRLALNLEAITTHLTALTGAQACPRCDIAVLPVLTDITGLLTVLARLADELAKVRLDNANVRAAIQATLGGARDGEPDPLDYLRWELPSTGQRRT